MVIEARRSRHRWHPRCVDRARWLRPGLRDRVLLRVIVAWHLHGRGEERETRTVRLIGVTFFALAACLVVEITPDLIAHARPGHSVPRIAVTATALIMMPLLAVAKRRTGRAVNNRAVIADSAETAFRASPPPPC